MYIDAAALATVVVFSVLEKYAVRNLPSFISECGKQQVGHNDVKNLQVSE